MSKSKNTSPTKVAQMVILNQEGFSQHQITATLGVNQSASPNVLLAIKKLASIALGSILEASV